MFGAIAVIQADSYTASSRNSREQYCPNAITTGRHKAGTYQQYLTSPALYASRLVFCKVSGLTVDQCPCR